VRSSAETDIQAGQRILVVEDRFSLQQMLAEFLREKGYECDTAAGVREGLEKLQAARYQLVLLDLKLPDGSGMDLLQAGRRRDPGLPVILMTAFGTIEESVQAMKLGAVDFIQKPIQLDYLHGLIRRNVELRRLRDEVLLYREEFRRQHRLPLLISRTPRMEEIARQAQRIAATEATVLLLGETGSIHLLSTRRDGPFVEVNCAAIPETLLENELFGHLRGAYTGAEQTVRGKFELAHGGTLFLDEIGEFPLGVQSKLLKSLEDKKISPIGAPFQVGVDVRIVVATNRELSRDVEQGRFRSDLYYRIAQIPLQIPPLRERREDIVPLAEHFAAEAAARFGRPVPGLREESRAALLRHRWPGNVRELKNLVERAVIVDEDGVLDVADLFPGALSPPAEAGDLTGEIHRLGWTGWLAAQQDALARDALARLTEQCGHDDARLAAALGLSEAEAAALLERYRPAATGRKD